MKEQGADGKGDFPGRCCPQPLRSPERREAGILFDFRLGAEQEGGLGPSEESLREKTEALKIAGDGFASGVDPEELEPGFDEGTFPRASEDREKRVSVGEAGGEFLESNAGRRARPRAQRRDPFQPG